VFAVVVVVTIDVFEEFEPGVCGIGKQPPWSISRLRVPMKDSVHALS